MFELRLNIEADAVKTHPFTNANANRGNFILITNALIGAFDPDADAVFTSFACD